MILVLLLACSGTAARSEAPEPTPVDAAPALAPDALASTLQSPLAIHDRCRDRVELPEAGGECTTDADCAKAGCSGEVCTTTRAAAELVTSCERETCFDVLDTCRCQAGTCGWTVRIPEGALQKLPVPPPVGPPKP